MPAIAGFFLRVLNTNAMFSVHIRSLVRKQAEAKRKEAELQRDRKYNQMVELIA